MQLQIRTLATRMRIYVIRRISCYLTYNLRVPIHAALLSFLQWDIHYRDTHNITRIYIIYNRYARTKTRIFVNISENKHYLIKKIRKKLACFRNSPYLCSVKFKGKQSNAKKSTLYYMRSLTYLQYPSETTL